MTTDLASLSQLAQVNPPLDTVLEGHILSYTCRIAVADTLGFVLPFETQARRRLRQGNCLWHNIANVMFGEVSCMAQSSPSMSDILCK